MSAVHKHAIAQTVTTNGNSGVQAVPSVVSEWMGVTVGVAAVSGTSPSLTATVQWSADGVSFYAANPADTFTALTAVGGGVVQNVTIKAPYYRIAWTVTGTNPNFTVNATAHFA